MDNIVGVLWGIYITLLIIMIVVVCSGTLYVINQITQ